MRLVGLLAGVLLILAVLWDALEALIFPRRATQKLRLARVFYRGTWIPWRALGRRRRPGRGRESFLAIYGPMSVLLLFGAWASGLIVGFALLHWAIGTALKVPAGLHGFVADLYYSGTTFTTLGLGDVLPLSGLDRLLTIAEAGTGLVFLAILIGYLPVLSQGFSQREVDVARLEARAGSPPSAAELLGRHAQPAGAEALAQLLYDWEQWSANVLQTHISLPVLPYYRSQHDNQSWVAALTTVLDVCALIIGGIERGPVQAARLTFATGSRAAVELAILLGRTPRPADPDRLPAAELERLCQALAAHGLTLPRGAELDERLHRLRGMYEPYMNALGEFLLMPLPLWVRPAGTRDDWQAMLWPRS